MKYENEGLLFSLVYTNWMGQYIKQSAPPGVTILCIKCPVQCLGTDNLPSSMMSFKTFPKLNLAIILAVFIALGHGTHLLAEAINLLESPEYLKSPQVTNWGDWGLFEHCPENTFVTGVSLKMEPSQGEVHDDTALNGISLHCGVIDGASTGSSGGYSSKIQSSVGPWGKWGPTLECACSYAVGFQLRSQAWAGGGKDDAATTNLRLYCNASDYVEGAGLPLGNWTQAQFCPPGWALCGLRTQVEALSEHRDDSTGINNVDMRCCDLSQSSNWCSAHNNYGGVPPPPPPHF